MPLGCRTGQQDHKANSEGSPCPSLVSYYAFEVDPFAQIGVLMGTRQRMAGRLIGEVYAIQDFTVQRLHVVAGKRWKGYLGRVPGRIVPRRRPGSWGIGTGV